MERVLEDFRRKLVHIVTKRIPSKLNRRVDAEDVVQAALISFTLGVRDGGYHFADMADVEHLLVAITLNKLRCACRREHAGPRDVDCEDSKIEDVSRPNRPHEPADSSGDPLEQLVASDLLRAVLEQLPSRDRDIVNFWMMDYTIEEIAHKAGCSKRHVDHVLAKARRRLRELERDE